MSNEEELLLIVAAVYLYECLLFPRAAAAVFFQRFTTRWRHAQPDALLAALERGVFIGLPLPPLGRVCVVPAWPVAMSPLGVCIMDANAGQTVTSDTVGPTQTSNSRAGHASPPVLHSWHDLQRVRCEGSRVLVERDLVARCDSDAQAALVARSLRGIAEAAPVARGSAIDEVLRTRFDSNALQQRIADVRRMESPLRVACNLLVCWMFGVSTLVVWQYGFELTWPYLLSGLVALWLSVPLLFIRAHRRCLPGQGAARRARAATMFLLPPAAIRACDALWRDALVDFDPLTVARALCPTDEFPTLARRAVFDHPPALEPPPIPSAAPGPADCRAEFNRQYGRALRGFLTGTGARPEDFAHAPPREGDDAKSYCPRCLAQYARHAGFCARCESVAVVRFA